VPIYSGELPSPENFIAAALFSIAVVVLGWWFFEATRNRFAAYL
jgi:ABC-type polysaccharide/polyol phosphate export permease